MSPAPCFSHRAAALLLGAALLSGAASASAAGVEEFYRGRTVTIAVGFAVPSAYDSYARVLARHMAAQIPGRPTLIVQTMPGAGSMVAANYVYGVAPKDGSVFAIFGRSLAMEPLLGNPDAKFDGTRFVWLGSVGSDPSLCVAWHKAAVKDWADMMAKDFVFGTTGLSTNTGIYSLILKNEFGARLKLVSGYPGGGELALAMEKGEIDGRCGWSLSAVNPGWIAEKKVNVLAVAAIERSPAVPGAPLIQEFATSDQQRQVLEFIFSRDAMGWPFAAPPGIPEDRRDALRAAFDRTMRDPAFRAEAEKDGLTVNPATGSELDAIIARFYATAKPVVADAIRMIGAH